MIIEWLRFLFILFWEALNQLPWFNRYDSKIVGFLGGDEFYSLIGHLYNLLLA